jgi:nicotinic acid phosphoribosyltransferase
MTDKQKAQELIIAKLREGLIKDFNELYVKEFTTEWKMERFCRKSEINLMSFDNTIKALLSAVEGIELTKKEIIKLDKENIGTSESYLEWLKNDNTKLDYRDWKLLNAQLEAVKKLLGGK